MPCGGMVSASRTRKYLVGNIKQFVRCIFLFFKLEPSKARCKMIGIIIRKAFYIVGLSKSFVRACSTGTFKIYDLPSDSILHGSLGGQKPPLVE